MNIDSVSPAACASSLSSSTSSSRPSEHTTLNTSLNKLTTTSIPTIVNDDPDNSPLMSPPAINDHNPDDSLPMSPPTINNHNLDDSPPMSPPTINNHNPDDSPPTSPPTINDHNPDDSPPMSPPTINDHNPDDSPPMSPPTINDHNPDDSPPMSPPTINDHNPDDSSPVSPSHYDSSFESQIFEPVYPGAAITVCGAFCAIMQFCTANKLSYAAITDLLKLLALLCPAPNMLPTSLYMLKKFFNQFRPHHHYKKICLKCQSSECSNSDHLSDSNNTADVVHLDIQKALQKVISGKTHKKIHDLICIFVLFKILLLDNWESLHDQTLDARSGVLKDVWDGSVLHLLSTSGRFFSSRYNLALALSTDGVPLFKSSSVSIWPVYLVVLNLAANIRMNAENIILCGLWTGPSKPIMKILLDPVVKCIQSMSSIGMEIKNSFGTFTFRAKLVMAVFDLPAKAAVLCAKQFNGEYGCSVCLHQGKRLPNNSRVYLPNQFVAERTHQQVVANAIDAERTKKCVQGVFKISPLTSALDLVNSIPIDYMHAVLEGVTRMLMRSWVDSTFHSSPFYIGRRVAEIDHQLLQQSPPNEFSRPPRSIKKHFKYWKASELRNWLLFYSLPLLLDFLPSLYWHHYALLVNSIHILLGSMITDAQLDAADHMLADFYALLPELYGEASCTANAHLLCHLTKYVRLWGPLWTHSSFGYESKNGQLKHLFHGKHDIFHQILFNIDVSHTLQQVRKRLLTCENENTVQYLNYLTNLTPRSNMIKVGMHSYIVGQRKVTSQTPEESSIFGCTEIFFRLLKDGVMYYSTRYNPNGKRDNSHCCYHDNMDGSLQFGQIQVFTNSRIPCALVKKLHPLSPSIINKAGHPCRSVLSDYQQADLLNNYMFPVELPTENFPLVAVPIHCIISKLVIISSSNACYCVKQPNSFERH